MNLKPITRTDVPEAHRQTTQRLADRPTRLCKILLIAYMLVMPWAAKLATSDIKPFDVSRVAEILLMALCAATCTWLAFKPGPNRPVHSHLIVGLGLAVLLGALSTAQAAEPSWAIKEAGLWVGMAVITALVGTFDKRAIDQLMIGMLASHLFFNLLNLIFAMTGLALEGLAPAPEALTLGYENRRFFNHVQTISLPLVMIFFSMDHRRLVRLGSQWMFGSGLALLIATGGRASLLGVGLSTLLATYLLGRAPSPSGALRHIGKSYAWGAFFYASIFLIAPRVLNVDINTHLSERAQDTHTGELRVQLAHIAIEEIKKAPLLGIGPMQLAHQSNSIAAHPHNIYFQIGAEWGLVTLALFLGFGIWLVKSLFALASSRDTRKRILAVALGATLVSIAADAWFSGNFVMPVSQVWIAIAVGLALNAVNTNTQSTQNAQRTHGHLIRIYSAIALTCILATGYLTYLDVQRLDPIIEHSNKLGGPGREKPRYWSSGWF